MVRPFMRHSFTLLWGVMVALVAVPPVRAAPFDDAIGAYKRGDYELALRLFRPLAEAGDAKAQGNVGRMYALGQGVTQDYTEAMKWFRRSAEQGEAIAQFNLGLSYESGQGTTQDYAEAAKWYQKAAEQNYADAQKALGDLYFFGDGVAENDSEAMRWYRKAADQGLSEAQFSVGSLYEHSESISRDLSEAAHWYQLAAEQGNADAEFALGELYRDGRGVPQDDALAHKWFSRTAENPDRSHRNHALSELHLLAGSLPTGIDAGVPSDPFGRTFQMVWPRVSTRGVLALIIVLCAVGFWQFKFANGATERTDMELDRPPASDPWSVARKAELLFWLAFILLPFFTGGWQGYHWLPHESYEFGDHVLLGSHEVCDETRCADKADIWKDKETGEIYTPDDFAEHRHTEAFRMALAWFVYGAVGCLAFAYFRNLRSPGTFWKYLRWAFYADAALAAFTFIDIWH